MGTNIIDLFDILQFSWYHAFIPFSQHKVDMMEVVLYKRTGFQT